MAGAQLSVDGVELATGSASLDDVSAACEHEASIKLHSRLILMTFEIFY